MMWNLRCGVCYGCVGVEASTADEARAAAPDGWDVITSDYPACPEHTPEDVAEWHRTGRTLRAAGFVILIVKPGRTDCGYFKTREEADMSALVLADAGFSIQGPLPCWEQGWQEAHRAESGEWVYD